MPARIAVSSIYSEGIKNRLKRPAANAIINGFQVFTFLYCSIDSTTKSAVKAKSRPFRFIVMKYPNKPPMNVPVIQYR